MVLAPFPVVRPLIAVLLGLGLAGAALASDSHAAPAEAKPVQKVEGKVDAHGAPEAKPAAKAEPKGEVKAEGKAEAKAETAPRGPKPLPGDPMDRLRERLAEKLGATKPADAPSPNVVRVAARSTTTEVRAAHPGSGGHGAAAAPSAATLAAAHRETRAGAPAAAAAPHAAHWSYDGNAGPEAWAQLQPEFAKCSTGTRQSPIDIRDGIKVELEPVQFDYRPTGFRVVDNGHTIQVNVGPGNSIEVLGRRYELLQFHFHRPSEERVNGRQFDMVAHLVHKDLDGRLAVVAVLLDRGVAQPLIQQVWNNLPLEKGDEVAAKGSLDLNALLPDQRQYFTYMGSLTTPPCSEGVLWMVMKKPVQISAEQLGIFARMYPMNARPIQSAQGRTIKESN